MTDFAIQRPVDVSFRQSVCAAVPRVNPVHRPQDMLVQQFSDPLRMVQGVPLCGYLRLLRRDAREYTLRVYTGLQRQRGW